MITDPLIAKAEEVLEFLRSYDEKLVTVESCTGGLIVASLTEVPGSSDVVEGGLVTYSNLLKRQLTDVSLETLEAHGAVSEQTARQMAEGALTRTQSATVSVAVTGIAGPSGGSAYKPVGTVCFSIARRGLETQSESCFFKGDRHTIRQASALRALDLILSR
ncbi:hypothetical protein AA106555_0020 [Neokomagataea thailandica NBRC 106555]|uniref:CinA family protein n=2 Tax=Neokomagataea TaxID=1223423 RepID=A0A4Y6VB84_9PROT|nr:MULTISPECIES: CinA family protein [Neokomagataea]QDH25625.1 CinA family protein [Neokomagataea tanensis]GBR49902.1 hypothetical protein AA106555_0020 [Neokomagataea thailandica NBRC 106555]